MKGQRQDWYYCLFGYVVFIYLFIYFISKENKEGLINKYYVSEQHM